MGQIIDTIQVNWQVIIGFSVAWVLPLVVSFLLILGGYKLKGYKSEKGAIIGTRPIGKMAEPEVQIKETYEDNVGECGLIFSNSGSTNLVNCRAQLLNLVFETPHTRWSLEHYPKVEDLVCTQNVAGFGNGKIPLFRWGKGIVSKSLEIVYQKGTESIGYGVANVPMLVLLNVWADNTQATYAVCKLEGRLGWGFELSILKTGLQQDKLELATFQLANPDKEKIESG